MMMKMTTTVTSFKEQEECSVQRQRSCPQRECGLTRRLLSENLEKSSPRSSPKREAVVTTTEQVRPSSKIRSRMQSNKLWIVTLLLAGIMLSVDAASKKDAASDEDVSDDARCLVTDKEVTGYSLKNGRHKKFWRKYQDLENQGFLNPRDVGCPLDGHDKFWELICVEITAKNAGQNFQDKCVDWTLCCAVNASLRSGDSQIVNNFQVDIVATYFLNNCIENKTKGKKYVVFSLLEMAQGNETGNYLNLYKQLYESRDVLRKMDNAENACLSEHYSNGIPMELTLDGTDEPIQCRLVRKIITTQQCVDTYHYSPNRELQILMQDVVKKEGYGMLKNFKRDLLNLGVGEPMKNGKLRSTVERIMIQQKAVAAFKDKLNNPRLNPLRCYDEEEDTMSDGETEVDALRKEKEEQDRLIEELLRKRAETQIRLTRKTEERKTNVERERVLSLHAYEQLGFFKDLYKKKVEDSGDEFWKIEAQMRKLGTPNC